MRYYAVVDCDNCFVSCERVFRPDLAGKPVVVLSNNDGCVVSRSNEAKQMGIKTGTPYFKLLKQFPNQKIEVFSGNVELYGDLTGRVMNLVSKSGGEFYRYSIDEAFVTFNDFEADELRSWGEGLHKRVMQYVGIPVSIGIAPNKTLAKMASHFAKHHPGYHHCCLILNEDQRHKALQLTPIDEVWGIGRRLTEKLRGLGLSTALDFAVREESWVRTNFNIVLTRTWKELNGMDAVPTESEAKKKSICVSRSFPSNITELESLLPYVSSFASLCAEKLRKQGTSASSLAVFLGTNRFREDLPQYGGYQDYRFLTPTDSTITLVEKATECLKRAYRAGYSYKRAGVVVQSMEPDAGLQTNIIDYEPERFEKLRRLDNVVDRLNRITGRETITLASQHFANEDKENTNGENMPSKTHQLSEATRHEHRSPNYSTRWADIIELH